MDSVDTPESIFPTETDSAHGVWMTKKRASNGNLPMINRYVKDLCGLYSRVARKLGLDRSYVSRVAKGERHSEKVEKALASEFKQIEESKV